MSDKAGLGPIRNEKGEAVTNPLAQQMIDKFQKEMGTLSIDPVPLEELPPTPIEVHSTKPNPDAGVFTVEDLIHRPGTYTVTITPEVAERLLERNHKNRPRKERAIQTYAKAMLAGEWERTNQGIGFDRLGNLIDGQNRLYACVHAGVPFTTDLATGLRPEAKEKVDVGVKRSLADALRMEGFNNAPALAGGISLRSKYEWLLANRVPWTTSLQPHSSRSALGNTYSMTHVQSLEFLGKRPSITERAVTSWVVRKTFPRVPLSVIIAFESMAVEVDADALSEFRNALITGANLSTEDPRLVLRNYLTRLDPRRPTNTVMLLGIFVKAWNSWRKGERRQVLAFRENEQMPELV